MEIVVAIEHAIGNRQPRIVVHGDIMLDEYLGGEVERISPEAPIPVVAGGSHIFRLGGAANVAANLASLGAEVELTGIVGDDEAADHLERLLEAASVGAKLTRISGRRTTRKLRVVAGAQQIVRIDFEDTGQPAAEIISQQIEASKLAAAGADALVISDYAKGACSDPVLLELIAFARANGIPVLADPKGRSYAKYTGSTIITPNRREASEVLGVSLEDSVDLGAAALEFRRSLDLEACVITLGPHGMFLSEGGGDKNIPALSRDVADVTGAGDCVIAAMALAIACGLQNFSACVFANAVASISVSRIGSVAIRLEEVAQKYAHPPPVHRRATKLVSREDLANRIDEMKGAGETIVFTNGCFDVFHAGHVHNLHQCADLGTVVIVGLNGDASVRALKGPDRPINTVLDRAAILMAMEVVDVVVIFDEDTPEELLKIVRPDVLAKGSDYRNKEVVGREFVESYGGRVELVSLKQDASTTAILDRLKGTIA